MRRVGEHPITRVVTYELADGRRINFDGRAIQEYGIEALARHAGLSDQLPRGRVDVIQNGRKIGTVPATFEPSAIKSTSFFYSVRHGDFVREGDSWTASWTLGPGDFEAVPGFVWDRSDPQVGRGERDED